MVPALAVAASTRPVTTFLLSCAVRPTEPVIGFLETRAAIPEEAEGPSPLGLSCRDGGGRHLLG